LIENTSILNQLKINNTRNISAQWLV
jgi:hypothetical protein